MQALEQKNSDPKFSLLNLITTSGYCLRPEWLASFGDIALASSTQAEPLPEAESSIQTETSTSVESSSHAESSPEAATSQDAIPAQEETSPQAVAPSTLAVELNLLRHVLVSQAQIYESVVLTGQVARAGCLVLPQLLISTFPGDQ